MSESGVFACARGQVVAVCRAAPYRDGPGEDAALLASLGEDECVLAVADGAGGHRGGGDASTLALQSLSECLFDPQPGLGVRERILRGFDLGHQRIASLGIGAATTLAVAHLSGDELATYHVGDSTILLVGQRGRRKHLTVWHSPVGYELAAGTLDEAGAIDHAESHLVIHLLGLADLKVEMSSGIRVSARDTLLLASDGLLDNVALDEVSERIRRGPLDRCARACADLAARRMSEPLEGEPSKPDDLSLLLYRRSPTSARRSAPGGDGSG